MRRVSRGRQSHDQLHPLPHIGYSTKGHTMPKTNCNTEDTRSEDSVLLPSAAKEALKPIAGIQWKSKSVSDDAFTEAAAQLSKLHNHIQTHPRIKDLPGVHVEIRLVHDA